MRVAMIMLLFLFSLDLIGCSCWFDEEMSREEVNSAGMIFMGKAICVEEISNGHVFTHTELEFDIIKWYKGGREGKRISIKTPLFGPSCRLGVLEGDIWILWASKGSSEFFTSSCTRSCLEKSAPKKYMDILEKYTQVRNSPHILK